MARISDGSAPYVLTRSEQDAWALLAERIEPHLRLGRPEVVALQRVYEEVVDAGRPRLSRYSGRLDSDLRFYGSLVRWRNPHGVDDYPTSATEPAIRHIGAWPKDFPCGGIRKRIIDNSIEAAASLQKMEHVFLRWHVEAGVLCPSCYAKRTLDGSCKACEKRRKDSRKEFVAGPLFWRELKIRRQMVPERSVEDIGGRYAALYLVDNTFAADDDFYRHNIIDDPSDWQERRHQLAGDYDSGLLEPDPDILSVALRDLDPRRLEFKDCRACGKPMLVRHAVRGRPRVYHEYCKEAAVKRLQRGSDVFMKTKEQPAYVLPGYADRSRRSRAIAAQKAAQSDDKDPV